MLDLWKLAGQVIVPAWRWYDYLMLPVVAVGFLYQMAVMNRIAESMTMPGGSHPWDHLENED